MLSAREGADQISSERGWGDAEQDAGDARSGVGVAVRNSRGMRDGVAALEAVVLRPNPQVERALEDDHHLLIRVVGVRLVPGPTAGLDRGVDDLEAPVGAARQELV